MKSQIKALLCTFIAAVPTSHAAITNFTITFDDPAYLSSNSLGGGTGSASTGVAFTGQDGWSLSTSSASGTVVATTDSGSYAGGQAVHGNTYIGANSDYLIAQNPERQFSFDLFSGTGAERLGVGGWSDLNDDGLFQQNEMGLMAGFNNQGGTLRFGGRAANFGTDLFVPDITVAADTWYRMQVTYDDDARSMTLDVWNLTLDGIVIDLNGPDDGTSYTFAGLSESQYGFATTEFDGITMRLSNNSFRIDNISSVPEPGPLLFAFGALGLLGARRRR